MKRVLAGMEAGSAGFNVTVVLIGLADLKLKATAFEVLVEAFESRDRLGLRRHAEHPYGNEPRCLRFPHQADRLSGF